VAPLVIAQDILDQSFEVFRRCGGAEFECVVYWTGPRHDASVIDGLHHPDHESNEFGYSVDSDWLSLFLRDLYQQNRSARAQIHTHPGEAFHSVTDDGYALVPAPGFISIVIPDFAQGRIGFECAAMYRMSDVGVWVRFDLSNVEGR
jgi:DNA-binding HxlR family transcriptional regulator